MLIKLDAEVTGASVPSSSFAHSTRDKTDKTQDSSNCYSMLNKPLVRKAVWRSRQSQFRYFQAAPTNSRESVFNKTFSRCNASGVQTRSGQGEDSRRIIVFFDGMCEVCSAEIRHYEKLLLTQCSHNSSNKQTPEPSPIAFFDLTESSNLTQNILKEFNIPEADPFKRVHVIAEDTDHDFQVLVSTRAFCEIWARVPRWRHLVPLVRYVPGVMQLSDVVYGCIADTRLRLLPSKSKES